MGIKGLHNLIVKNAPNSVVIKDQKSYCDKIVAIDTSILIYQYVIAIRGSGQDLVDNDGKMTSHIFGIIYKTLGLLNIGIKPIFVFDGKPPAIKQGTLNDRKQLRIHAQEKLESESDDDEKNKLFKKTVSISRENMEDCKEILQLLGLPVVNAPEEADAQCAYLAKCGAAYAVGSEDMDLLTFGSVRLLRNLTSSKRHEGVREFELSKILEELKLTHEQFVDLCILLGCDYTDTIHGLGPINAIKLISQYKSIDEIIKNEPKIKSGKYKLPEKYNYDEAREYFRSAKVKDISELTIEWKQPDYHKLFELLHKKYSFSDEKILEIIRKIKKVHPAESIHIPKHAITTYFTSQPKQIDRHPSRKKQTVNGKIIKIITPKIEIINDLKVKAIPLEEIEKDII